MATQSSEPVWDPINEVYNIDGQVITAADDAREPLPCPQCGEYEVYPVDRVVGAPSTQISAAYEAYAFECLACGWESIAED